MTNATSDAAAERVLNLTPADLPVGMFRLNHWSEVPNPAKFLQLLQARLRQRQAEPAARDSTLDSNMIDLLAVVDGG